MAEPGFSEDGPHRGGKGRERLEKWAANPFTSSPMAIRDLRELLKILVPPAK